MNKPDIEGRFLPSRVYHRWKWTVRFGILIVPFLVLLSGGLILFLTPNQYESTSLFRIENGPAATETMELLQSGGTLERTSTSLDLPRRWDMDRENSLNIVRETMEVHPVPDTSLVKVTITRTNKIDARDIADQLPVALHQQLLETSRNIRSAKARELDSMIQSATDTANDKSAELANIEKIRGSESTALARARRASMLADAEVERLQSLQSGFFTENIDQFPQLIVHTHATISDTPAGPEIAAELNQLALKTVISGLLTALLLPYLLELNFPLGQRPRKEPLTNPDPVLNL